MTGLRDEWLIHSMLKRVGDLPQTVFLPVLRIVTDDREDVESQWKALVAKRRRRGLFEPPQRSWQRQYGQFVAELEWVTAELLRDLPFATVEELVSDAVAGRLRHWLRFLLPMFGAVRIVPKGWYAAVMDMGVGVSTFLVGPIHRTGEEADGTLVYEIPECAMHVVVGTQSAQENSCQMGCKAACEKVFHAGGPMPLEFDPHLPGLGCTLRVHPAH
ncbi:hypothetical protein FR943_08080 [Mycobacterium sp. TNTM28]|uniref:Uncharacterized protein n=1 Tax=[Mycobacterium] fortunisiensis TaxID=2600579 RepID=A0ABS6KJN5_9MYCO|nr:hypothetical protein [[Mycobacterium] fortunisiensis]MBU9763798.1 hypothetical protein [[Mycobacterium] fortunisiensis]